jgi:rSAM/selenodomain-associated transferase 2
MKLSIIIPVLNEARNLVEMLPFFLNHKSKNEFEVIVVDGGSEDDSIKIAQNHGFVVLQSKERSRGYQMNLGARRSTGEILYFVHADTRIIPSFFTDITIIVADGVPSGCYSYSFDSDSRLLKVNSWFTQFNGLLSGGGDQTLFVKREVFEALGGFDERYCIMEDFDFVRRLKKKYCFQVIPKEITVSARKYESNSWIRVQLVNLLMVILFHFNTSPITLKRLYSKLLVFR